MSNWFNLPFSKGHPGFTQPSLLVKFSGLGIHSAVQITRSLQYQVEVPPGSPVTSK